MMNNPWIWYGNNILPWKKLRNQNIVQQEAQMIGMVSLSEDSPLKANVVDLTGILQMWAVLFSGAQTKNLATIQMKDTTGEN